MIILEHIKNLIEEVKINFSKLPKPKKGATDFIQKLREEKKIPIKYPELNKAKVWHMNNKQELKN